jgi:opacity protein-like surface antigen
VCNKKGKALKNLLKSTFGVAAIAMCASPVFAQADDWEFEATIYLFTAETDVKTGNLEGKLSFSDAVDNLDVALMGAFGVRKGRLSFLADYMLTDLSFGNATPGPNFSGLNTRSKTQIFSGYAAYSVYQNPTVNVDLAAGFRWFDTSTTLTLTPALAAGTSVSADDSWVDPVIGFRTQFEFSEKWSGTVFADYGGFSSDSETWQILLTANYNINDNWVARFGYRQISVDHDIDGSSFSFEQSGPIFGATYRF